MRRFFATTILFLVIFFAFNINSILAQGCDGPNCPDFVGPPTEEQLNNQGQTVVTLPNPIGESDPRIIVGNVIKVVLGLVGSLALVLFIYGGVVMMTSAGNSDRVATGRNTLVWATIGLLVIFSSYTIVGFIIRSIPKG